MGGKFEYDIEYPEVGALKSMRQNESSIIDEEMKDSKTLISKLELNLNLHGLGSELFPL